MIKGVRYKLAFQLIFLGPILIHGQPGFNYVPNPSFNFITSCPSIDPINGFEGLYNERYCHWLPKYAHVYDSNNVLIDIVDSGITQFGSPNPFHSCNGYYNFVCTPLGDLDGGGGVGMGISYNTALPGREFSAVKLTGTLKPYQSYCISFYMANCSAFVDPILSDVYYGNKQMIAFASDLFIWPNSDQIDYRSYLNIAVENDSVFGDTGVWHKIQDNYIANGSENYLFLGWAEPESNISTITVIDVPGVNYGSSYTLFDSISVVECDEMGMNIDNLEIPNAISPNGDGINDTWNLNNGNPLPPNLEVQIFNRWGTQVYQNTNYANEWNGTNQNGDNVTDGVFFYVIQLPPNQKKAGFIYVVR
jgi:gliding motility-associated-like protein